ncbi:MAG: hypothetical protein LBR36_07880 [Bacteroidales bacterium]|nr:hypothetical protein [Bacteroidales bacterium]
MKKKTLNPQCFFNKGQCFFHLKFPQFPLLCIYSFVNKGIQPDIVAPDTWENYLSNKDIALEKAVEYLKSKEK